ncbi:glycosyl hydrolase family 8 [Rhizobium sp. SSA_523]|uniref:glycosyl hydrolase family 8 n=1 Tax=Rhizobium sp. SSA_523 TaxID=2952477 RepID=UPI00209026D9|nr:glycosyl hydrolase family 8 [Rhizobium sp. SSA_523]MCO5734158.1 glycosyl hydrolase family 8 [Rhizobium sp. SSA_523]WKC22535.1 glycosyl hydrolase family 8 [Rhizobium sp. SSA_523]
MTKWLIMVLTLTGLLASNFPAAAQQGSLEKPLWQTYKTRFLDASGRIVDNANGGISHSEGQGYGLLLAFFADSPSDFAQIWSFTKTELMIRDDGLAAWRWDPASEPHVTDLNNASDGDLLIAYALALAGAAWDRDDYLASAAGIARAVLSNLVVERGGRMLLLPAAQGFDSGDRADGPVINPSYWIFETFPVMAILAPSDKWSRLERDGLALLPTLAFGPRKLPAEWVSLARQPKPADGFAAEFGYNAIRIPLYLLRAGPDHLALASRLQQAITVDGTIPAIIDLENGAPKERLTDPGYAFVNHIMACVSSGTRVPNPARELTSEFYYPATLHLLGLAYVVEKHPSCL